MGFKYFWWTLATLLDSDNETGYDGKEGSEKVEFEKPEKDNKESKWHIVNEK